MNQDRFEYEVTREAHESFKSRLERRRAIDEGSIPESEISHAEKLGRAHRYTFELAKQIKAKKGGRKGKR